MAERGQRQLTTSQPRYETRQFKWTSQCKSRSDSGILEDVRADITISGAASLSTVSADSGHHQAAAVNDSPALPNVQRATELQVNMTAQPASVTVNSHQEQLTGMDLASFTATVTALQGMLQRFQPTVINERREMDLSVAEPHGPLLSIIGQYEAAHPAPVVSNQPVCSQTLQAGQRNNQHPGRHAGRN